MGAPTIDLGRLETGLLVESVRRPGAVQPFGLYCFDSGHPGAELGRMVERAVFGEAFGDSPELLAAEYDPYEAGSIFFVVIDHRRALPCGAARVIVPSPAGLKTLHDLDRHWGRPVERLQAEQPGAFSTNAIWDLATQAVVPEYQGQAKSGLVAGALYHGIVLGSVLAGARWWVAVMDDPVLRLMNIFWKRPFATFAGLEPKAYLGSSSSTPAWTDVDAWRRTLADRDPHRYADLHDLADDPVTSMPDWDEVRDLVLRASPPGTYEESDVRVGSERPS